ncbi:hypothetical protein BDR07DRAFT_1604982 [Suillus spraguei]|nr:hypothetical protein BDR07DRAFT_1604982 [Suillus spraguei]
MVAPRPIVYIRALALEPGLSIVHESIHAATPTKMDRRHALNFTTTLLLCCAVLFCIPFACASRPSLNDTSIHTLDSSDPPSYNTRTLWDIISSCGLTLFACTWTAVHPDIPYMDQGIFSITFRRLFLMVVTLIAPEIITLWAVIQLLTARQLAKNLNDIFGTQCTRRRTISRQSELEVTLLLGDIPNFNRTSSARWTLTHGFFACMGGFGFVLYIDGEPQATLTPKELLRFVREGSVEMPVITKADIEDRSKGDVLSKCIAILQLVWFLIQLIARYAQILPVTLLEIDTLGIAVLACISYGLWLKKSKDIGRPYIVHWNSEATAPPPGDSLVDKYYSRPRLSIMMVNLVEFFVNGCMRPLNLIDSSESAKITTIVGSVSGMVFGAIHCLGWNFVFPRHTEQILWRVASIGMACSLMIPFVGVVTFLLSEYLEWIRDKVSHHLEWIWDKVPFRLQEIIKYFVVTFGGLCASLYLFSRVTIIVLMFLSLRSLPPGAYDTVVWTKFIPHLNT